ncbi:MAG: alpha-2-macroglobulin family protein, partial [Bacteroidaceae bacterium]
MKWLTFRDKTTPGAEETWTMQITKNGKPIDASLLATVYDASLNKIKKHTLPFHLNFNRSIQTHTWSSSAPVELNIVSFKPLKLLKYVPLSFTTPTESYFSSQSPTFAPTLRQANIKLKKRDTALTFASAKGSSEEQALAGEHELDAKTNAPVSNDDPSVDSLAMRTDFSETAFFSSSIKTDSCGVARIEFRLPQSITAWNFMALAHTQNLDYAFADTIVVVEKPLTIETNTPRFLRKGDKTVLAVTATNHDTTAITGKINLLLTDAATGKKLYSATKNLSLPQKSRDIVEFPITVTDETTLILCRTIGTTDRFDDGEQQYIPVISDHRKSITSIPFSIVGEKQREISLEKLYKQPLAEKSTLTLEYTANPAWSVLNALPSTVGHNPDCATTLAANYASLSITRAILKQFPQIGSSVREWLDNQAPPTSLQPLEHNQELKQTALQATPWQQEADQQRQRLAALAQDTLTLSLKQNSMLDKLKALQTAQGGWQWFPGMTTGTSLTIDITHSLLLTISNNPSISGDEECTRKTTLLINKAMTFLDNMATKQLETIKQNQATPLSPSLIKYLYLTTLIDRPTNKTIEKLIETLAKQSILTLDNLYYKSLAACVLNKHGKHNEAQKLMQSLMQHTTNDTLSGRFFDSSKAPGRYSSYRMETHLATLNALQQVWPDSTIYINEMKRWLTQSKHTQDWANPLLSVNAAQYLAKNIPTKTNPSHFGKIALYDFDGSEILSADTSALKLFSDMGYIKINTPSKKKHKIVVSPPKDNQLSYGAAYLTNYLPIEITQASSSGFELNIKMYKETTRGLQAITSNTRLSKSDRVTMRYEIKARRNYDFVSLTAPRAACMEPTDPLSGYRNGGYRAVGDTGTTWFFDHLSKGEHVVEEQFDIDRSGTFVVAPAQTQCLYAPEFGANSSAIKIIVID